MAAMDHMAEHEWTRALPPAHPPAQPMDLTPHERQVLEVVFTALQERGYDPARQLAHFLVTGEPAYITAHRGARTQAQRLDRVRLVEALVRAYLEPQFRPSSSGNDSPHEGGRAGSG